MPIDIYNTIYIYSINHRLFNQLYSENRKKADILNKQFQSVFTHGDPLDIATGHKFPSKLTGNQPRRNVKAVKGS